MCNKVAKAVIVAEVERVHWRLSQGKAKNAPLSIDRNCAVLRRFHSTACFCWNDHRHHDRCKVIVFEAQEFIRRFLPDVLPNGFQHIRDYGLLGNHGRQAKLVL